MGIETAGFISELVAANPTGSDDYATADDHLRLIKAVLLAQFPNFTAIAVTPTAVEMNFVDGVTSAIQAQLDGKQGALGAGDVTIAMLEDVDSGTFLARDLSGSGPVLKLTAAQATAKLNAFTSSLKGMVSGSGGGTEKFLRADDSWQIPAGSGSGVTTFAGRNGTVVPLVGDYNGFFALLSHVHSAADISTGTLAVARGGTGVTAKTGTGNVVLSASPTFTGTVLGAALTFSGQVQGGSLNASSDRRLKDNITEYAPQPLSFKPQIYDLKSGEERKVGYIAQDVMRELPAAVSEDANGMLALDYNMVFVAKIADLEARLAAANL